jgi:hypothetical protein
MRNKTRERGEGDSLNGRKAKGKKKESVGSAYERNNSPPNFKGLFTRYILINTPVIEFYACADV